uniref:Uncharacterized protein n=1 Tax=Anopheles stephensi TaxID=30069 RepID=A0A182YMW1_ANOST
MSSDQVEHFVATTVFSGAEINPVLPSIEDMERANGINCKEVSSYIFQLRTEHSYCQPPSFVEHLSVGGLFKPSDEFLNKGKEMEFFFLKFIRTNF